MSDLVLGPNSTAQWHTLVREAEQAVGCELAEDLESYLVFLLMRFASKPELAHSVLALEYLHGQASGGGLRHERLREVGDKCLLYSGLFPQRARRRRVRLSYFVDLGRGAYHTLAQNSAHLHADTYEALAEDFVRLMDVLQIMRRLRGGEAPLDPMAALELFRDTGSAGARRMLREVTDAEPFEAPSDARH